MTRARLAGASRSRSPVKLTFLIDTMEARGGMQRVTATVAGGLVTRGFDVEILTLSGTESVFPLHGGVRLTSLGFADGPIRMRTQTLPIMRAIRTHVRRRRPDVLLAVDTLLSGFAFPALLGLRVRRVAWEHFHFHFDFGMRSRRLARWIAALLGHDVLVLTRKDAEQWQAALPRLRARLQVMANPLPLVPPASNPYSPDRRVVLAVGRLDSQKGFDMLLSAWARVEPEFPEWTLRVVGSGEEQEPLRRQAEALDLRRWTLAGPTAEVEREYLSAGLFCLSSRHEGLPMVLIETQAYGVPAVAFDCLTGPAELLEPGGGVLVEPGNVPKLAGALRAAMSDAQARREMSDRAFENAGRYEAERVFGRWAALMGAGRTPARKSPLPD